MVIARSLRVVLPLVGERQEKQATVDGSAVDPRRLSGRVVLSVTLEDRGDGVRPCGDASP